MIISSIEGRYLSEMFPSFLARYNLGDDSKSEIQLRTTEFHYFNNSPNSKLYMSIPPNSKPYFYVKKQIPLRDDEKTNYYKSIQKEKEIFLKNFANKNDYENMFNTKFFDCKNADENCPYSPFLSIGQVEEKNFMKLPFYPGMSLSYLISQKAEVSDTDKQIWAYELACAFANLHQRDYYHTYFTSADVFLTPNLTGNELNSPDVHMNIILGNFSYDVDNEPGKSKLSEQFFYRCPEFTNDSSQIPNATTEKHKKNDIHAFGVFLNELFRWESPQTFLQGLSRKDRLEKINHSQPSEYLNIVQNPDNRWISLILNCVDKDPTKRPDFKFIKSFLANEQNFLPNVNVKEFEYRIRNVKTDTTCYFETLAYVNKKYPTFEIIKLILEEIKNEIINQYLIKFDVDPKMSIVDQLFQILNSSFYFLKDLIKRRILFFKELISNDCYREIMNTYTENEEIIDLIEIITLNEGKYELDNEKYQKYKTEIMKITRELKSLSNSYYQERFGQSEFDSFDSAIHKKDIEFLYNHFKHSFPISENQIKIIYNELFNCDYSKSVEFLSHLSQLHNLNPNYFDSLEKVYTILQNALKNSSENSMSQVNNIYKNIYEIIMHGINDKTDNSFNINGIHQLVNKIQAMIDNFDEEDKLIINNCMNVLTKGIIINKSLKFTLLNYTGPAINIICIAEQNRRERLQKRKIEITSLSKSSLRTYLTRVVKSYQSSYKIEITITLENNKGSSQHIRMSHIVDILTKLGVEDINTEKPNQIVFILNGT